MQKVKQRLRSWFAEQGFHDVRIVERKPLHWYGSGEEFPCRLIVFNNRNEPLLIAPEPLERTVPRSFRREYPELCWLLCSKDGLVLIRELDSGIELSLPGRGGVHEKKAGALLWVLLALTGIALLLWQLL